MTDPNPRPIVLNPTPTEEHPPAVGIAQPPRRRIGTIVLAVLGFAVLIVIVFVVAIYLFAVLGPQVLVYSIILAAIPLVVVLFFIRWIDRWEPEPRGALLFAFLWGAAASVFIALVFSSISQNYQAAAGLTKTAAAQFFSAVIQAPIVEETAKGFGILLLLWALRHTFDGPVDGVVYGATIGIGFAFTENLQYFGLAIIDDHGLGGDVAQTFILRAILSPFAHVMFTSCTGLALGFAARNSSRIGSLWYFIGGLIPAVFFHAFWNSASYWATNWFGYYFFIQVPLFIVAIVGVARLRRHEQLLTYRRLSEYAAVGWFSEGEVNLLSTGAGRRSGLAWAKRNGIGRQYKRFIADATKLAFTRERLVTGKDRIGATQDEAALLAAITADRQALAGR
ncbi:PrsW family intramembrane metalloprotease [soil metagenome]